MVLKDMKKLFIVAALFVSAVAANAQQFGVKGGLTLSGMDGADKPKENKATALYRRASCTRSTSAQGSPSSRPWPIR